MNIYKHGFFFSLQINQNLWNYIGLTGLIEQNDIIAINDSINSYALFMR